MPVRRGVMRKAPRMRGRGIRDILRKAHDFIKKHQLVSKAGALGSKFLPAKYRGIAGKVGDAAGVLGYGRRRGGSLRLAGSGMRSAF